MLFRAAIVCLGIFVPLVATSADLPSCLDFVEGRDQPGASPRCAPMDVGPEIAYDILKDLQLRKIGQEYYVILGDGAVREASASTYWRVLPMAVSAIQTLYGENVDIYVIREPSDKREASQLVLGEPPEHLLLARARYDYRGPGETNSAPPNHFVRPYILIVRCPACSK